MLIFVSPLLFKSNLDAMFKDKFHWLTIIFIFGYTPQCQCLSTVIDNTKRSQSCPVPLSASSSCTMQRCRQTEQHWTHQLAQSSSYRHPHHPFPGQLGFLSWPSLCCLGRQSQQSWGSSLVTISHLTTGTLPVSVCSRMAKSDAKPERETSVLYTRALKVFISLSRSADLLF